MDTRMATQPQVQTKVQTAPLTRRATRGLVVLFAINILNFYDRHVPGALTEPIRKEFHLSDTEVGWLSTAFTLLYAVVGLPIGRLADTGSRKKLLAMGVGVWSALTAFAAVATNYTQLLISRLGVSVGEAVCAPTATSWIGDLFPPDRRSKALALFMLGVPVGGALSYFFSGPMAQAFGWRTAMVLAAAPAVMLIPLLLTIDEPRRGASDVHHSHAPKGSVWTVLKIPTMWWIIASGALLNFNMYAIGTFLPAFLGRVHGFTVAQAGIATGFAYAIGGILGGTIAGHWGDHVIRTRKNGRMQAAAIASLLAAPAAYFGIVQPKGSVVLALPMLALAYGCLNMYYGLVYSSIQDIVAPSLRATTMAVYFLVMYLGGASFGPVITGSLSDRMARSAAAAAGSPAVTEAFKAAGLQQAMLVIPILSLGLALVLWAGSRTIAADMEKARA
jgi:predicted MFS family arabinose efflux permease